MKDQLIMLRHIIRNRSNRIFIPINIILCRKNNTNESEVISHNKQKTKEENIRVRTKWCEAHCVCV
jgi:hypothetical protein